MYLENYGLILVFLFSCSFFTLKPDLVILIITIFRNTNDYINVEEQFLYFAFLPRTIYFQTHKCSQQELKWKIKYVPIDINKKHIN